MKGDFKMKVKFLAIFLTGLLLGALFGNILFGQVIAQYYHSPGTELYYLKKILNSVKNIEDDVSWIKFGM
jgi:hypothetical protein